MGRLVQLDTVFTDLTLPRFYPEDVRINNGTLVLLDFNNTNGAISSVPVNGSTVPNIAWKTAATLIGAGDVSSLALTVANTAAAGQMVLEMTQKKGLHAIVSQVNDVANKSLVLTLPAALRSYMVANFGHQFYVSMWGRNTRLGTSTLSAKAYFVNGEGPSVVSNYLYLLNYNGIQPIAGSGARIGAQEAPSSVNTLGNFYRSLGLSAWSGTKPAANATAVIKFGNYAAYSSFELNKCESWILYSFYVEDLTVSGRTYAQADAADKALYDVAFGAGGRFAGDTFTDPATLA